MNKNKIANTVLAGVLALAVVGIGYSAYRQKAQADTIVPGFATVHLGLKVTIPTSDKITMKAVAYPELGGKKYYFKERTFTFDNPGVNNVEWYIRKIPAGNYKVSITSSSGTLDPQDQMITLSNDLASDRLVYELYLGEPLEVSSPVILPSPTPSPEELLEDSLTTLSPTATVTATATTSASTDRKDPIAPPALPDLSTN